MAYTAKYCGECNHKLSPADKSPEAKAFIKASAFTEGSTPVGTGPKTKEGSCDKCGKFGIVTYYEYET